MKTLIHGIPCHGYFAIMLPEFNRGGQDCAGLAMGIGMPHWLEDPHTHEKHCAELVMRRTVYTCDDTFEALCLMVYGLPKEDVMRQMRQRHPDMEGSLMQLWVFKKE